MNRTLLLALVASELEAQKGLAQKAVTTPEVDDALESGNQDGTEQGDSADDALLAELLTICFEHEATEGDAAQMQRLSTWAAAHSMSDTIPAINGDLGAQKAETPEGGVLVAKSMLVTKAWRGANNTVNIEGWVSTEDRDTEKDIVPPEAFAPSLNEYMSRYAPVSLEHNMRAFPIGHLQQVALVRDGTVFQQANHPTDPADFEHFPGIGTGVYGRGVINDDAASGQVMKGNMAGFSWVGRVKEFTPLAGGGRRFGRIEPWMETTLSAYPINSKASLVHAGSATQE